MTENAPAPPSLASRRAPHNWRAKRILPRSLYGRALLIIVVPTLITLAAATFVFFNRHWYTVSTRLTYAVAGDIAAIVDLMEKTAAPENASDIVKLANDKMDIKVAFAPGAAMPRPPRVIFNPLRTLLNIALKDRLRYPFQIDMRHAPETIAVRVDTPNGIYTFLSPQRRIYTPTTEVFIAWMVGSSILLSAIALLFMRNQIRPIRRLADAADAMGKGQEVPWFKIEGASEVRQAGAALMVMRDRLRRQMTQRTAMLAGVSHDLRTPLTRMRLQIEMMGDTADTRELANDIAEMEAMLNAYLAFARGEESEPIVETDLAELIDDVVQTARRQNPNITLTIEHNASLNLRRGAIRRCLSNLIGNALRYGKRAEIAMRQTGNTIEITIDDDGPGIAPDKREEMFRPFTRLEASRNPATGGIGLGLTIARDIARAHGGDVTLEESPLGGLRAKIWLPV
ncbi:MAG: ATP-binding protein [Bdellovibrionales bacterium]